MLPTPDALSDQLIGGRKLDRKTSRDYSMTNDDDEALELRAEGGAATGSLVRHEARGSEARAAGDRMKAEAKKARLRAAAPDLANLVDEGRLNFNEAMAAFAKRKENKRAEGSCPYWEIELRRVLTPKQWREHEAFIRRRNEFYALSFSEMVDMAKWVLAVDSDLAEPVKNGIIPLFEAYHELKQAEDLLASIMERQRERDDPEAAR
jgi:hypothetical protein